MKGVGVDRTSAKGAMGKHRRVIIYSLDDKMVYYYLLSVQEPTWQNWYVNMCIPAIDEI